MKFYRCSPLTFRTLFGVIFATAGIALLVAWSRHVQKGTKAAAVELQGLQSQWGTTSAHLADARKAQLAFDAVADQASRVLRESDRLCWSSALQGIVASTNESIDLRDIRARRRSDDSNGWSLRIAGFSQGTAPRLEADTFRRKIEQELVKAFKGEVSARLVKVEDIRESGSDSSGGARAGFTIEANITVVEQPPTEPARGT